MSVTEPSVVGHILLFGDSIANGLGVGSDRYGALIARQLRYELIDVTRSGTTVLDSLAVARDSDLTAEVAIIAHGVTEAIIRPHPRSLRLLPPRWRRRGWMDPRPFYSSRTWKRILEKLESALRWRVKVAILRFRRGQHQVVGFDDYIQGTLDLCEFLASHGVRPIVLGPPAIDDRYFPGSSLAQSQYFAEIAARGIATVAIADKLDKWSDYFADHFHPNHSGHAKIASEILSALHAANLGSLQVVDPKRPGC